MNIIKLNAIDSTNRFLKDLAKKSDLENFTVAVAEEQFQGKGQIDTSWQSEKGKNLLFTVYAELKGLPIGLIPYINFLTASVVRNVVVNVLNHQHKISVKWPNDIMSYNDKICGILVENTIRNKHVDACFVGIGLNVNQLKFPLHLAKVSSIARLKGVELDKEIILEQIIIALKKVMCLDYIENNLVEIKQEYLNHLYKINTPAMFKDMNEQTFMGKIIDVTNNGLLLIEKEDELVYSYAVKEIKLL